MLRYSGQWWLTLVGEILNLRESHISLWSVSKPCPLLCARSSESHMHVLEGRLCCAWEHQHPVLLETSKSFSFSSAGITLFILHVDCTWQQIQQPLPRAPQTTQPSGEICCTGGGFATGWTPGDGVAPFPSCAAKHLNARYASCSAGTQLKLSTHFNALLKWLWDRFKKKTQQTKMRLFVPCKRQRRCSPEPWATADPAARAQNRPTSASPAASAFLSLQPNFCTCQTLLSLGALMQSAAIWLE